MQKNERVPLIDRLIRHTPERGPGCWKWCGATDKHGYGCMEVIVDGKEYKKFVHRIAFKHFHPEWDGKSGVIHSCDNPPCWNPKHIRSGDQKANVRDMMERNRAGYTAHPGERNGRALMNSSTVLDIRRRYSLGETNSSIAEALGLKRYNVQGVTSGKTWRCV